jgi:glycosyltransferase involved in cell wall biosynthesis
MISVVVPAHNEEENLPVLMENIRGVLFKRIPDLEVVLVDDNSADSTPEICDELAEKYRNIRVIHRKGNPGMGNALKDGTRAARGDIIVWLMADLSDDLDVVPEMLKKIQNGCDMVFGSRYMEGGSPGDLSGFKTLSSRGFSFLSRIFIGIKVHDITNAFRGFRKEVFDKVQPESGDFGISPEFALKAYLMGFKLGEVPVIYKNRKRGVQKFRMLSMSKRYFTIFLRALFWRLNKRYKK